MTRDRRISVYFDREKREFVGLDAERLEQLKDLYPGINVDNELKKMTLWLTSWKGKDLKGTMNFITNWLNKVPITQIPTSKKEEDANPLRPYIDEYLKGLWKGREHILEMNRINKKQ
jgi:hypothetical protein